MKFTKEQAVEKLNQVLTNSGKKPLRMSTKTLESHTETLMTFVANEEMELDEFVEKVKGSCENINSNMERDHAEFVRDYKQNNPPQTPAPDKSKTNPEPNEPNDQLELLNKKIQEMEARELQRLESAAVEAKRNEIRQYLKSNKIDNEKWIDSVLGIATISKDDDVEAVGKTYLGLYNQVLSSGSPAPVGSPNPGEGVTADSFADVKALRKRRTELEQ